MDILWRVPGFKLISCLAAHNISFLPYFRIVAMIVNEILSPPPHPHPRLSCFILEMLKIAPHYPERSVECVSNQYSKHAVQKLL